MIGENVNQPFNNTFIEQLQRQVTDLTNELNYNSYSEAPHCEVYQQHLNKGFKQN